MTFLSRELYNSDNGDRWLLIVDDGSGQLSIRHEPNLASGGQPTERDVGEFLRGEINSPERQALLRLIGDSVLSPQTQPNPVQKPEPNPELPPELMARLARPTIRLSGTIDEIIVASFFNQLLPVLDVPGSIVVELFSSGGDADIGRRLAQEIRLLRERHGRDMWFLGKTLVASAAVTVMASFPRDRRWLTRDTMLLIHGRRMLRNLHLEGPLGSCRRVLEEMIADIDNGLRVEEEGFAELIGESAVSLDDIRRRSYGGWYLNAAQALDLRLVGGLI